MRWIGERSYGIYLWTLPIVVLTSPGRAAPTCWAVLAAGLLVVAIAIAGLAGVGVSSNSNAIAPNPSPRPSP
jgi:peptidoglycan/LPS O-acetylase OafA/YrhL